MKQEPFVCDEIDAGVWAREFEHRLPPRIYDVHSHSWEAAEHRATESADPSLPTVVEAYPLAELRAAHGQLFPGREVSGLVFGSGGRDTDYAAQNARLGQAARGFGYQTLLFARPEWSEEELERQLTVGHLGLKPYWFLAGEVLDEVDLSDMISPAMLRVADRHGLIVMTHIPRLGRLADLRNREGLRRLCAAAPRAKFVLAHFGRSYFPEAVAYLDTVCDLPNLWTDCAMVQDWEVYAHAFRVFPRERILFGLDLPFAMEKGKLISVNGQRHFFTARPHPWSVHVDPGAYEVRCTRFAYEMVRALLRGAETAGLSRAETDAVFWDNAQRLVASISIER